MTDPRTLEERLGWLRLLEQAEARIANLERVLKAAAPTIGAARTLVNAEDAWMRGWTNFSPFEGAVNEKNAEVVDMAATDLRTMLKLYDKVRNTEDAK